MAAATPTLDTVIEAVKTELDSISPDVGDVITSNTPIEDDIEWVVNNSYLASGAMNLLIVTLDRIEEVEGEATAEYYEIYHVRVYVWTVRTNSATWDRTARQKAEAARDELAGNAAVFAISGQRQIRTPETVQVVDHGPSEIRGPEGPQMIYRSELQLAVEGRRWS